MNREQRLAETFVELADTLVDDFDVIDFLQVLAARCVELLEVGAAGIMLAAQSDSLVTVAASDERARLLELFERGLTVGGVDGGVAVSLENGADDLAYGWAVVDDEDAGRHALSCLGWYRKRAGSGEPRV